MSDEVFIRLKTNLYRCHESCKQGELRFDSGNVATLQSCRGTYEFFKLGHPVLVS